jgi:hypothetical protein
MTAYERLEAAAKEFCTAAALAADEAHWEEYGEDGTPDYPYSRAEMGSEEWMPIRDHVVKLLQLVKASTEAHLKLLRGAKEDDSGNEEITAPFEFNPPNPKGINPPNTTKFGPLPKSEAIKAIKTLECLEKLGAQIRVEKSNASDGTELWTIYCAPIPEDQLTPEQKAARDCGRRLAEEPPISSVAAPPRREDRFKSKAAK